MLISLFHLHDQHIQTELIDQEGDPDVRERPKKLSKYTCPNECSFPSFQDDVFEEDPQGEGDDLQEVVAIGQKVIIKQGQMQISKCQDEEGERVGFQSTG